MFNPTSGKELKLNAGYQWILDLSLRLRVLEGGIQSSFWRSRITGNHDFYLLSSTSKVLMNALTFPVSDFGLSSKDMLAWSNAFFLDEY
jgi:hypothetical protein